jgi:hypothetical protein
MIPTRALLLALAVDVCALIIIGWLCAAGRMTPETCGYLILGICGAGAIATTRSRPGGPPPSGALSLALLALPLLTLGLFPSLLLFGRRS